MNYLTAHHTDCTKVALINLDRINVPGEFALSNSQFYVCCLNTT